MALTADLPLFTAQERRRVIDVVRAVMLGDRHPYGPWLTVPELVETCAQRGTFLTQTCASAMLRDLRKAKHGGHQVDRKLRKRGVYEYRVWAGRP